jgi:hypothetical protein
MHEYSSERWEIEDSRNGVRWCERVRNGFRIGIDYSP